MLKICFNASLLLHKKTMYKFITQIYLDFDGEVESSISVKCSTYKKVTTQKNVGKYSASCFKDHVFNHGKSMLFVW